MFPFLEAKLVTAKLFSKTLNSSGRPNSTKQMYMEVLCKL